MGVKERPKHHKLEQKIKLFKFDLKLQKVGVFHHGDGDSGDPK